MIQLAQEKPDMRLSVLLVLLPSVIGFFGYLFFGFPAMPLFVSMVKGILKNIAVWLIVAIVFYVVAFLIKGKIMRGTFTGIASSIALLWIVVSLLTILSVLSIYFVSPVTFEVSKIAAWEDLSQNEAAQLAGIVFNGSAKELDEFVSMHGIERVQELKELSQLNAPLFNPLPLLLVVIIGAFLLFYGALLVPFFIVAEIFEVNFLQDFTIWLLLEGISFGVFWLIMPL